MLRSRFVCNLILCLVLTFALPVAFGDIRTPTLPGDCDHDWEVDLDDFTAFQACVGGPGQPVVGDCTCFDLDGDGDVDLHDFGWLQRWFVGPAFQQLIILDDADDGTEVNRSLWRPNGYIEDRNGMGADGADVYDIGLRFRMPDVSAGQVFKYARLVVPGTSDGVVSSSANLRIVGVDLDSPPDFSMFRPSEMPKTEAAVSWMLTDNWPPVQDDFDCSPLWRYGPDISPIINQILSRPDWGTGPEGKTLAVVIEDDGSSADNFMSFQDFREIDHETCPGTVSAQLELYRTVESTFLGRELLGRLTDHSATVSVHSLLTLEVYIEYGTSPGVFSQQTSVELYPGGDAIEVVVDGLTPDTRYVYRMRYRRPEDESFLAGVERSFHTQRAPGSTFVFTVQADSHHEKYLHWRDSERLALHPLTLLNVFADRPDFHISLGDFNNTELFFGRFVLDFQEAVDRNMRLRPLMGMVCHSAAFYLVIGNHEGEQAWYLDGTADNLAVHSANGRKFVYPNPVPDDFYSGNTDDREFTGLLEDYYAWEWGDALFVVIDPYAYTFVKPHSVQGGPGSENNWDWTHGFEQYEWFRTTLENSDATFKFVFAHQVTGGTITYGRGGIEAASHELGGVGSYEWGGENLDGTWGFDTERPGWYLPIHQTMVENDVTIFFHGHDHVFVKQDLDGIVYQEVATPNDLYGQGFYSNGHYDHGDKVNNSGHMRITVSPCEVTAEYIRAYLPGDGENGQLAYAYTIPAVSGPCAAKETSGTAERPERVRLGSERL